MKKLYFNLLCLLFVIFIIYCFTRTEGFLTIDASQMCVQDSSGAVTCDRSTINDEGTVGQQGHKCTLPDNTTGYIIPGTPAECDADPDCNMYSGAGFNPGSIFDCDVGYERVDPNIPPTATPCFAHDGPIILNGCISKCQQDPSLSGKYGGTTLPSSISDGLTPLPGVTCDSANLLPATNKCYQRDGTILTSATTSPGCTGDNTWFSSGELQAVCHNRSDIAQGQPVVNYKIIGCEEGCLTRNSGNHKQDYITGPNEPDTGGGTVQGDNREVIYINDQKIPATQDPYDVSGETVLAAGGTFNVAATCGIVTDSDGTSVPFAAPFGPAVTEACNLDPTSQGSPHLESRRYSVSGCYPTCSEVDERCINMLFSYTPATPAPDLTGFKENLLTRYMANNTGTALTAEEQQQFKDQIYYYRKYRHNDQDHIEAQFKCFDIDCQFAAASIDAAVQALGGTASAQTIRATEMGLDPADILAGRYELCDKNHRVLDNRCVPCTGLPNTPEAELNEAGDDPLGDNTTCLPECGRTPETIWMSWSGDIEPPTPGATVAHTGARNAYSTFAPQGTCLCPETTGTDIFRSVHNVRTESSSGNMRCHVL